MASVVEPSFVEAGRSIGFPAAYLRLARPKQWTKNGFVLAGVIFSGEALRASSVVDALLAFIAFCALSGAVYAANDILDVVEDRGHPTKRLRPVASGEIPIPVAVVYAALLALFGLALAFLVGFGVGLAGLGYLALQAVYTPFLKHMAVLDVMSISAGFVIRALAGVAAVGVPISPWLVVCTGLLTLFLGFSKRRYELYVLGEVAEAHRKNLKDYSVEMLDQMMNIMVAATIIAYTMYTYFAYGHRYMMVSVPLVIYGVLRSLIPAILGLVSLSYAVRFVRWAYYLKVLNVRVPLGANAAIFAAGLSMTISPGKLGEVLKSVFIKDVAGTPVARTAPAVVAERATDGTGMILWGLLGALAFSFGPWLLLLFLALTGVGIAVLRSRRLSLLAEKALRKLPLLDRLAPHVGDFHGASNELLAFRPLVVASGISFLGWGLECAAVYLCALGVGAEEPFLG